MTSSAKRNVRSFNRSACSLISTAEAHSVPGVNGVIEGLGSWVIYVLPITQLPNPSITQFTFHYLNETPAPTTNSLVRGPAGSPLAGVLGLIA
jgi:hypothetical protein